MKLNYYAFELLKIFENELRTHRRVIYQFPQTIDISKHIILEQDKHIDYYTWSIHELFMREPTDPSILEEYAAWQIIETYRIINTALVSCSESIDPIRTKLAALKVRIEAEPYLKTMIDLIDSGQLRSDLVCSGHGVWYKEDGEIDLSQYSSTTSIVLYSGLGASLSNRVGVKIENGALKPNELALEEKSTQKIVSSSTPMFFSAVSQFSKIPNFCLVSDRENLPLARVIEPLTGRTVYSMADAPEKKNYFSLGNVLEKYQGRVVHWAACTGQRERGDSPSSGPFFGYRVVLAPSSDAGAATMETAGTSFAL